MYRTCEEALVSSFNHVIVLKLFSKMSHSCLHLSGVQMKILLACHWPCKEMRFALSYLSLLKATLVGCSISCSHCKGQTGSCWNLIGKIQLCSGDETGPALNFLLPCYCVLMNICETVFLPNPTCS